MHSKRGKKVRLENALPKVVNGPKAHLKGDMVRKHITQGVRAQRSSQKEAGLENTLPKR